MSTPVHSITGPCFCTPRPNLHPRTRSTAPGHGEVQTLGVGTATTKRPVIRSNRRTPCTPPPTRRRRRASGNRGGRRRGRRTGGPGRRGPGPPDSFVLVGDSSTLVSTWGSEPVAPRTDGSGTSSRRASAEGCVPSRTPETTASHVSGNFPSLPSTPTPPRGLGGTRVNHPTLGFTRHGRSSSLSQGSVRG